MSSQPQSRPQYSSSSSSFTVPPTPSSKLQVLIPPTSHLDPGAYVRGTYTITIGAGTVIHPRAHLLSIHGPLSIGDGCIVGERCVVGGPLPVTTTTGGDTGSKDGDGPGETVTTTTVVGSHVYLYSGVQIHAGGNIGDCAVVESGVVVGNGVRVGRHAKVTGGISLPNATRNGDGDGDVDVLDWTVVYGENGNLRRRNRRTGRGSSSTGGGLAVGGGRGEGDKGEDGTPMWEVTERLRLEGMRKEREGIMAVLKGAAVRGGVSGTSAGGGSGSGSGSAGVKRR